MEKNKDGSYTAQEGDSAWSLYQQFGKQDGFTAQQANDAIESQHGPNYIGKDGGLKSDTEIGDVVTIGESSSADTKDESTITTADATPSEVEGSGVLRNDNEKTANITLDGDYGWGLLSGGGSISGGGDGTNRASGSNDFAGRVVKSSFVEASKSGTVNLRNFRRDSKSRWRDPDTTFRVTIRSNNPDSFYLNKTGIVKGSKALDSISNRYNKKYNNQVNISIDTTNINDGKN